MDAPWKTFVVKIGTSTLNKPDGSVDREYLDSVAAQLVTVRAKGWRPIIVTSGAIACGLKVLGITDRPDDIPTLQAAASVGQSELATGYREVFAAHGLVASSVLLTRADTASRSSYLHARATLSRLVELNVIPVVNENDTVSVEQIRFGDNDTLSALVACLVDADLDIIFSDIEGLYDADPHTTRDVHLIEHVDRITDDIAAVAGGPGTKAGSGGMITKICAARVLMSAGIPLVLCNGHVPDAIVKAADGISIGTRFASRAPRHRITARKLWIALGDQARGALIIDDGAVKAIVEGGASLLSVGIVNVEGSFEIGDIVDIKDTRGHVVARGRVQASSDEVMLARGFSQEQMRKNRLLAQIADAPIVHRDETVIFD